MLFKRVLLICLVVFSMQCVSAQLYVKKITAEKIPVPYAGKVLEAYEYSDAAGLHYYLATDVKTNKMDSLFVRCYTKTDTGFRQDWQIRDFSPYGITYETWLRITDIDKDGIYETVFAYRVEGDVLKHGDLVIKLILHYKNQKFAIRNWTHYGNDENKLTMDQSFNTLPKQVKAFAVNLWNKEIAAGDLVKHIN